MTEANIETKGEKLDCVDCLRLFVETRCMIVVGMGASTPREEFSTRFAEYCLAHEVNPPSPELLASILRKCYSVVFPGTTRDFRGAVPVWLNLILKPTQSGGST
jgi:hypothetical protein